MKQSCSAGWLCLLCVLAVVCGESPYWRRPTAWTTTPRIGLATNSVQMGASGHFNGGQAFLCLRDLRGGSVATQDGGEDDEGESNAEDAEESGDDADEKAPEPISKEPVSIMIQTNLGNSLVDQSIELNVQRSRTVASLKESVRRQLPGKPPVSSMRLVMDGKTLDESMIVNDLIDDDDDEDEEDESDSKTLVLLLDMIPPVDPKFMTQIEERLPDMTTSELLQAFAVNEAALLKNAVFLEQESMQPVSSPEKTLNEDETEGAPAESSAGTTSGILYLELREEATRIRKDMEQTVLASETARRILEDDQPPSQQSVQVEVRGQRIRVPRMGGRTTMIKEQIQRNLNVNWADTIRYCVLFLFFGYFGGRTPVSRAILLLGAPSVFVLQARPIKLLIKQFLYTVFDHPPGIFLSLLPAPQQAILNLNFSKSMHLLYSSLSQETRLRAVESDEDLDADSEEGSDSEDDLDG